MKNGKVFLASVIIIIQILFGFSLGSEDQTDPDPKNNIFNEGERKIIFSRARNLTQNSAWNINLAFIDFDNNSYPDIITAPRGMKYNSPLLESYPYGAGLYYIYYNGSNKRFTMRNNSMFKNTTLFHGINVNSDNDMDLFGYKRIYINNNGTLLSRPFTFCNDTNPYPEYPDSAPGIGDINSDGLYDIVYYVRLKNDKGLDTVLNLGDNRWTIDGWENGLKFKNDSSPPYYISERENSLYDINNDGWLDICSGMGKGRDSINEDYPMVYYNWVSDGKGNWTEYSNGFPEYEYGINIDLADIDNDGDLDFGLLSPDRMYILENTGKNDWKIKSDSLPDNIRSFTFEDVDLDGNQDIVFYISEELNSTHVKNDLWIGYSDGNWNWDLHKQSTIISGYPGEIYLKDMDRDGDKDIVNTFHRDDGRMWVFYTGGIYCVFNDLNNSPPLTFTETFKSPHVRTGSVNHLEWSGREAWKYADSHQSFNLSISYTGESGTYYPLKSNLSMWWTELIVPDIPSHNAYLKVEWRGYNATSGPFGIHNPEDMGALIEPTFPVEGDCLVGGGGNGLNFRLSRYFESTDVSITIKHDNGSYRLKPHRFKSANYEDVSWYVPDDVLELNCTLQVDFMWRGDPVHIEYDDIFNIVPGDKVPREIEVETLSIPIGINTTVDLTVYNDEGIDISSSCWCTASHDRTHLDSYFTGDGAIRFMGHELGTYPVVFHADRYGHNISLERDLRVCHDLDRIWLSSPGLTYHVSEWITVDVLAYNSTDKLFELTQGDIDVSADLESEIVTSNISSVKIKPLDSGMMNVSVDVDSGLGVKSDNITFEILSYFNRVELSSGISDMYVSESSVVALDVERYDYGSLDEVSIRWEVDGPADMKKLDRKRIEITATSVGEIDIYCNVSGYSEEIHLHKRINSTPFMDSIELDIDHLLLDLNGSANVNHTVFDSSGNVFSEFYYVSLSIDDPSVVESDVKAGFIRVTGMSLGSTYVVVTAESGTQSVSTVFYVDVVRLPRRIDIESVDHIETGSTARLNISVYDLSGHEMIDFDYRIESFGVSAYYYGYIEVKAFDPGPGMINFTVSSHGFNFTEIVEFDIIHIADRMTLDSDEINLHPGNVETVAISLLDVSGQPIPDVNWSFSGIDVVSVSVDEDVLEITGSRVGSGQLLIFTDYYGKNFSESVSINVTYPTILSRIDLVELEEKSVRVYAFDQRENDITHLCDIEWIGDVENRNGNTTVGSGKITVRVSYDDKILEDSIVLENDESNGIDALLVAIPVVVIILVVIGSILLTGIKRRKRCENRTEE